MNIYEFDSYKEYLESYFSQKGKRGDRTKLAAYLGCQSCFVSQVLTGNKSHFSLEHIKKIGTYLKLDQEQTDYLILLCLYERAGSRELQEHFIAQIKKIKHKHQLVANKISSVGRELSNEQKATYYSHWSYMAIHMLVSIPEYSTIDKLCEYLRLPKKFIEEAIQFLVESNLIEQKNGIYKIGKTRIHLENSSPLVRTLHANWRYKAIESLTTENGINLHYSSVLVLSKKDIVKIKEMLLEFIKEKEKILLPSNEEEMVILNLDYFKI